jgi:hypothetical protein
VVVTDRNFHRNQLLELTGLEAEEMQARQIMNEIQQLKPPFLQTNDRSTPLSVAAYHWLENFYLLTVELLQPMIAKVWTQPSSTGRSWNISGSCRKSASRCRPPGGQRGLPAAVFGEED